MLKPFFFGNEERALFGIYRRAVKPSNHGVVLCYPHAHEYIRCHRAFREIAKRLVKAGCHVLTFDYYGCGDSGGEYEDGRLSGWCQDTSWAADTMRKEFHLDHVCLLGLRLGASMAMITAADRDYIDSLVLWDPVVSGKDLVKEMMGLQSPFPRRKPPPYKYGDDGYDIVGYPITLEMVKDLEQLDLLAVRPLLNKRIFVVETGEETGNSNLNEFLEKMGNGVHYRHIPEARIWLKEPYEAIVPQQTLQSLVAWISEVCQ